MKKIITLIIALLAFITGTQVVHAQATETLEVTLKSGIYLKNYPEGALAMELLSMVNQIKTVQEGDNTFVYSLTDKKLLTVNSQTSYITLAPDVSSADDISYNVTDADRETIREADMEMYEVLKDYKTVRVHFDKTELQNLAVTLKSGNHIAPASEEWYAFFSLMIIGQLKGSDGYVYTSDNKLLFTLSPSGTEENMTYVVTLAPGISSADDIIYTITDEDRAILDNYDDPFYEAFLSNYKTIQLHFDASEQELGDWTVEIKSGMTLTLTTSAGMAWYLLSNLFHQLKNVQDEKTEIIYVSTLDDKLLFMMDNNYVVTLAPGIGPADDIIYTITDEERMQLRENQEIYPYIADVKTIKMHFVADGQQTEDWVAWLKTGDTFETNTKAQTAVLCLYLLNQVQYVEEEKADVVYSLANKKLFTIEAPAGNIIIAPGVTSADDIIYTLTDADLEIISNYSSTVYLQMKACKTIELHFDVEIVEPKVQAVTFDFSEITMHPGEQLLLEPRFTPEDVKDKSLRYVDISGGHNVYIDESGLVFAQSEGYAYIQAFSSYTASGDELMATWGPEQASYLKITVTSQGPGEEIFFDHKEGNGPVITYHVTDQNGKLCEVAGRYDEDDCTTLAVAESTTGIISIPEEVMGYKVTRIGAFAFYELEGITEVWLPNTIEQIGSYAFSCCYNVKHVYIPVAEPLKFTDAYGDLMDESMGHNDAFYRVGEDVDGAILHVVEGSRSAWNVYPWNEWFVRIVDDSPDGISLTPALSKGEGDCYDLSGRKIVNGKLQKGISIIRYSDGTTKKIMVR